MNTERDARLLAQADTLLTAGRDLLNYTGGWDLTDPEHPIVRFRKELETVEGVRQSDEKPVKRACPKCGDDRHLYQAGADVRWRPDEGRWDHTGDYDLIECTKCDWTGTEEETEVKEA